MNALGKMNTEGDVERGVDLVKQCDGARASMGFMVNPPKQSISALRKLVGLFIKTKARYPEKFLHVKAWYPRIYPRTPLHSYLTERTDFPKTEAELLPRNAADLKRTFWINADNSYVNLVYNLLFLPKTLRSKLSVTETPHEARLFSTQAPSGGTGDGPSCASAS